MIRRLLLCAFVALSLMSARADVQDQILSSLNNLRDKVENIKSTLNQMSGDLGMIYNVEEWLTYLPDIMDLLNTLSNSIVNTEDAAIMLADTVSSNLPSVQEDVAGILSNINQLITDMQSMLSTLAEMQGATAACATYTQQIAGDLDELNKETTQQYIAGRIDSIVSFFVEIDDQFSSIANNTLSLVYQMQDVLGFYDDWDEWFYQQFEDAVVPYTSLSWYSLDDAPWLNSNRYRPRQNTLTFGSNLPRNFFKDLADLLVSDARINSDIANSILFICSQLSNTNQFAQNEDEFRSQLDDVVASANEDKSILDNMSFDFNLQTPSQFQQVHRIRQISKYSVNSLPADNLVVGGFQGFGNQISNIQGSLHLTEYSSFFIAVRNFFAFLYWCIFVLFLWKLFTLVFRFFAFFKFQGVNQSSGLFMHTANGGIV